MSKTHFRFRRKFQYAKVLVLVLVALTLLGGSVMLLWNWLMPSIFGLTTLSFWQAIGLFALARLLFSGLGFRGKRGSFGHRKLGLHTEEEREQWMNMSFSERREWFKKRGFHRGFDSHAQNGFDAVSTKDENDKTNNEQR